MTPKEAIKNLKKLKSFHNGSYGTAIDHAIKAIEQQPSEDCISRSKALEMLGDEPENWTDTEKEIQEVNDYRWFKSILESLPSVTPKERWIPCSERLPEEDGTLRGYLVNVGYWVGIAHFVNGEFWRNYLEKMRFDDYPVKAWMSLPTPYAESDKEEEKNEDNSL